MLHKRMSRVSQQHLVLDVSVKPAIGTLAPNTGLLLERVVRSLISIARAKDAALISLVINVNEVFFICAHSVSTLCTSCEFLV